ncbi:MAG: PIN domain-containing protein [archaeon]
MKESILIDTDIIIDLLRGYEPSKLFFNEIMQNNFDAYISVVSIMELNSGTSTKSTEEQVRIQKIVDLFKTITINPQIAQLAGFIVRDYAFAFPDALIASSFLNSKLNCLVTRNIKHFEKIKNIKIKKPY